MRRTEEIAGTSLQGYIKTTRRKITERFGEPTRYEESKSTLRWGIMFDGGIIATIYDWKRYELGEPLLDEEITYNIGGISPEAVRLVKETMKERATA